jgi:hypothetical protein
MMDPMVFRGDTLGDPLLTNYQTLAYLFSAFEIVTLGLWLTFRARTGLLSGFLGGVLLAGGIFCIALGAILAPYSLLGLIVGIGILGFTPFLTSFVYFRNGYRAVMKSSAVDAPIPVSAIVLGCLIALAGPFVVSKRIERFVVSSVDDMLYGNEQQASNAARRLRPLSGFCEAKLSRIEKEYWAASDLTRKELLRRLYQEATGEDIEMKRRFVD